jgi:hypothetical protein
MPSYKSRVVYITVSRCGFLTCTRLALTFLCDMFILIKRITSCISVEDYEYHKENAFSPPRCLIAIGSAEEKEESLQLAWISKNASCLLYNQPRPRPHLPNPQSYFSTFDQVGTTTTITLWRNRRVSAKTSRPDQVPHT